MAAKENLTPVHVSESEQSVMSVERSQVAAPVNNNNNNNVLLLPPLTDALARLLSLSADDQHNLRVLELLVKADPAAQARLLALASSPMASRRGTIHSLTDALQVLGSKATYTALLAIWATAEIPCQPGYRFIRDFLVRHIFSICAILRRLVTYAEYDIEELPFQLFALLGKVSLAFALSPSAEREAQEAMETAAQNRRHLFLENAALRPMIHLSAPLAQHWGVSPDIVSELEGLAKWDEPGQQPSLWVSLMLVAERLVDAARNPESAELIKAHADRCPVLIRLVQRNIDPLSFVRRA